MSSLICLIFTIISRSCFCRGLLYTSKNILNQKNLSYFNWSNFFLERTWLDFHYLFPQPPLSPSPFLFLTYLGPKKKQHQKHQKTTLNKLAHNMVKIRLKKKILAINNDSSTFWSCKLVASFFRLYCSFMGLETSRGRGSNKLRLVPFAVVDSWLLLSPLRVLGYFFKP